MARKRLESDIKNWSGVDDALLAIGRIDRDIEILEAHAQGEIEEVKARLVGAAKPHQERKKVLELQIQTFCEAHREEMKGKSRKLNFGKVSFHLGTKIVIRGLAACVEALKKLGLKDYVKVKESPNKERLRELDDAVLEQVGAKRVPEDVFGYEIDRERVQEAA